MTKSRQKLERKWHWKERNDTGWVYRILFIYLKFQDLKYSGREVKTWVETVLLTRNRRESSGHTQDQKRKAITWKKRAGTLNCTQKRCPNIWSLNCICMKKNPSTPATAKINYIAIPGVAHCKKDRVWNMCPATLTSYLKNKTKLPHIQVPYIAFNNGDVTKKLKCYFNISIKALTWNHKNL